MPITGADKRLTGQFFDNGGAGIHILHPDFGAKGDGTTDDTAAVQAWLEAVAASKGKPGIVSGRFKLMSTVSVELWSDDFPFKLIGSGGRSSGVGGGLPYGATFMLGGNLANGDTPMMLIDANQNAGGVVVEDIDFLGQNLDGTGLKILDASHRFEMRGGSISDFDGYGLWTQNCIGHLLHGPHYKGNATNWRVEGGVSFQVGEGNICAKFESPTSGRNILIGVGSAFLSFVGSTIYNGEVELDDGVYAIGFRSCSFEVGAPAIRLPVGKEATEIVVEGCVANPTNNTGAGTKYAFDFAGQLNNSTIRNNLLSLTSNGGATVVGVRIGSGQGNTTAPNRFEVGGAGTQIRYQLPDEHSALYLPTNDVGIPNGALQALVQHQTLNYLQLRGAEHSVANDGVLVMGAMFSGMLVVIAGGYVGLFISSFGTVTEHLDPSAKFSVTKDTASSVNVYKEGGVIKIQNKLGATWNINPIFLGTD